MTSIADPAVASLVNDADPAVATMARRDLLAEPVPSAAVLASPMLQGLLAGLLHEDSLGRPYTKWTGAHWRLVSLTELGVPSGHDTALTAADAVLTYWTRGQRLARVPVVEGRARRCASQEGNAVAVACRLGLAADERVATLAEHLLGWQWPDGGWNCDPRPAARRSSFHETLPAMWGLHEYATATGDPDTRQAVSAAAELLLDHDVVFSTRTGRPIHPSFIELHYPPYWHYDVLQALLLLHRAGYGGDPRTRRARHIVAGRRRPDGTWRAVRRWWGRPGVDQRAVEAVDWGGVANQMVTLNALRVGAAC